MESFIVAVNSLKRWLENVDQLWLQSCARLEGKIHPKILFTLFRNRLRLRLIELSDDYFHH